MTNYSQTSETNFILNCLSGIPIGNLSTIREDDLIHTIKAHKIVAAIGRKKDCIPESSIKDAIWGKYQENKIYQLKLTRELCQIHHLFNGIDFLGLKGPILSQYLYNDSAERTSWDLDILIDKKDIDQCIKILKANGYELMTFFTTEKQKEVLIKYHHHFEFYNEANGILIELHWKLTDMKWMNTTLDLLKPHTSQVSLGTNTFRILNFEQQFEYLSIHGTFHLFRRIQWLNDLKTFLEKLTDEQYSAVISYSKKNKTYTFILVSLSLLNEIFSVSLDSEIHSDIDSNNSVKQLTNMALREMYFNSTNKKRHSWEIMLRNHKPQYYAGGFSGLVKCVFARGIRHKNWSFFVFPDRVFFLNHIFSRIIWIAGKIKGKL